MGCTPNKEEKIASLTVESIEGFYNKINPSEKFVYKCIKLDSKTIKSYSDFETKIVQDENSTRDLLTKQKNYISNHKNPVYAVAYQQIVPEKQTEYLTSVTLYILDTFECKIGVLKRSLIDNESLKFLNISDEIEGIQKIVLYLSISLAFELEKVSKIIFELDDNLIALISSSSKNKTSMTIETYTEIKEKKIFPDVNVTLDPNEFGFVAGFKNATKTIISPVKLVSNAIIDGGISIGSTVYDGGKKLGNTVIDGGKKLGNTVISPFSKDKEKELKNVDNKNQTEITQTPEIIKNSDNLDIDNKKNIKTDEIKIVEQIQENKIEKKLDSNLNNEGGHNDEAIVKLNDLENKEEIEKNGSEKNDE